MINFYFLIFFNGLVFVFIFLMCNAIVVEIFNPMHVFMLQICQFFLFFYYGHCFCCFVVIMLKNYALWVAIFFQYCVTGVVAILLSQINNFPVVKLFDIADYFFCKIVFFFHTHSVFF